MKFIVCFIISFLLFQTSACSQQEPEIIIVETAPPQFIIIEPEPELEIPPKQEKEVIEPEKHYIDTVKIYHYCTCKRCTGSGNGITASGVAATPYKTIAVDPTIIPLGAIVEVTYDNGEVAQYRAEDTGNFGGNKIDVCVTSHKEALNLGIKKGTLVWWKEDEQ